MDNIESPVKMQGESDQKSVITRKNEVELCVTGYFGLTVDFDPGGDHDSQTASGTTDAFPVKFKPDGYW